MEGNLYMVKHYIPATDTDLRSWRAFKALSPSAAAKLFGVSYGGYHRWEEGKYPRDLRERIMSVDAAGFKAAQAVRRSLRAVGLIA